MTTFYSSLPSTPQGTGASSSLPGTPLSGISTVAIKDGHEGNRHSTHQGEYVPSSAERLARLGGLGMGMMGSGGVSDRGGGNSNTSGEGTSYFDRVSGWRKDVGDRSLTGSASGGLGEREHTDNGSTPGSSTTTDPDEAGSSTKNEYSPQDGPQKLAPAGHNGRAPGRIGLPPPIPTRRAPSSYSGLIPNPPCPTPNTPSIQPLASTIPNRSSLLNPLMNFRERESSTSETASSSSGTNPPQNTPAIISSPSGLSNPPILNSVSANLNAPSSTANSNPLSAVSTPCNSAPSPASTVTTNSVRQEKARAKMIGPMTYDEGVIDTTDRSPMRVDDEDRDEDMVMVEDRDRGVVNGELMDGVESTAVEGR